MVDASGLRTRAGFRGCLLGGAVADALGAPVEFLRLREIRARFGPAGVVDYAPGYGRAGAITDDTQMTFYGGGPPAGAPSLGGSGHRVRSDRRTACVSALASDAGERVDAAFEEGWLVGIPGLHAGRAPGNTCLAAARARTRRHGGRREAHQRQQGLRHGDADRARGPCGEPSVRARLRGRRAYAWASHGDPRGGTVECLTLKVVACATAARTARSRAAAGVAVLEGSGSARLVREFRSFKGQILITVDILAVLPGARPRHRPLVDGCRRPRDPVDAAGAALISVPGVESVDSVPRRWIATVCMPRPSSPWTAHWTWSTPTLLSDQALHQLMHCVPRLDYPTVHVDPSPLVGVET